MDNWTADLFDEMNEQTNKKIKKESDWYDKFPEKDIWVSPTEQEKIDKETEQRQMQKQMEDILKQFEYEQKQNPPDPIDILRNEMREELNDIKKAIHKIGILLDGDVPSEEILEKHKTLRDAYRKYKMIEALILGQQ